MIHKGKTLETFRLISEGGLKEDALILVVELPKKEVKEEDAKYSTPEMEATIHYLRNYNFSREQIIEALEAAGDDRDMALQFLTEGIPDPMEQEELEIETMFLENPDFEDIRQIIITDPTNLIEFEAQVRARVPELAELFDSSRMFPDELAENVLAYSQRGNTPELRGLSQNLRNQMNRIQELLQMRQEQQPPQQQQQVVVELTPEENTKIVAVFFW